MIAALDAIRSKWTSPPGGDVKAAREQPETEKAEVNQFEKYYRLINSIGVQFVGGDVPAGVSIWANTPAFPAPLQPLVGIINLANAVTGYYGIAMDMRVNHACQLNPKATPLDHKVDQSHFLVGDLLNTGASMIPLFVSGSAPLMTAHPLLFAIFAGGQAIGASADFAKIFYDWCRQGQQSALDKSNLHYLVVDRFEQRVSNLAQTAGLLSLESTVFPTAMLALPPVLAGTLMTVGGSFGSVFAYNQIKKGKDLQRALTGMKQDGVKTLDLPQADGGTRQVDVDTALARAHSMQRWGVAQEATSLMMVAAGVPGLHFMAIPALLGTVGVSLAATARALWARRGVLSPRGSKAPPQNSTPREEAADGPAAADRSQPRGPA
ncbi:MAG: hypothetical protein ACYCW6_24885 [Candidatus Xenobia bacterium]